jgi:hypothetical protein
MDNQMTQSDTDALARRMLNRIWNGLPQERRNIDELRSEALQLTSRAAASFQPRHNPYAHLRETYPNAGKPWKRSDDEELRRLFEAGNSIDDLMLLFGRTHNGIQQRLLTLGLVPQPAAVA